MFFLTFFFSLGQTLKVDSPPGTHIQPPSEHGQDIQLPFLSASSEDRHGPESSESSIHVSDQTFAAKNDKGDGNFEIPGISDKTGLDREDDSDSEGNSSSDDSDIIAVISTATLMDENSVDFESSVTEKRLQIIKNSTETGCFYFISDPFVVNSRINILFIK